MNNENEKLRRAFIVAAVAVVVVGIVFVATMIIALGQLTKATVDSKDNYSYVTDNGTSGDADFCDNGRGGLYCTKDGRTFTVKEYSRK